MGSFHLRVPSRGSVQDIFSAMPHGMGTYLREGFSILAGMPESKFSDLISIVMESIASGSYAAEPDLESKLGLSKDEGRPLLAASSIVASILTRRDDSPGELVKALVSSGALDASHERAVLKLADVVNSNRAAMKLVIDRTELAGEVLPSLLRFESAVDMRLRFDKGHVASAAPVAVMHVDTDAQGQEIWFQMSRVQLERIVESLQGVLKQLGEAETWLNKRAKES